LELPLSLVEVLYSITSFLGEFRQKPVVHHGLRKDKKSSLYSFFLFRDDFSFLFPLSLSPLFLRRECKKVL